MKNVNGISQSLGKSGDEGPRDSLILDSSQDGLGEAVAGSQPPPPFDEADLRQVLLLEYPPDEAEELVTMLAHGGLHNPGTIWDSKTLLLVASLSPAHEERMRAWLRWTPARMAGELRRVRSDLSSER